MAQTIVIGRITADLEMKTSANGNPYVRFDLVENIGSKENSRPQYFQICAWSIKCQDKMYKKYGIRMYINLLVECGFATGKIFLIL